MPETSSIDEQLLEAFRATRSEEAFRGIVTKYLGMVYGVARRKTQDHFVAEEISQNVFAVHARKASRLHGTPTLAGWLYRCTAIECAAFHRRNDVRLKAMNTLATDPSSASEEPRWRDILPVLDDAIAELSRADRNLLLMRFFEGQKFSEIGEALGKSPVAAQKQGERVLAKLAQILQRKGVAVPVSMLAVGLGTQLSQAAPAGLAFSISKGALVGISSLSAKALLLESIQLMAHSKLKVTAVAVAVTLPLGVAWKTNHDLKDELARLRAQVEVSRSDRDPSSRPDSPGVISGQPVIVQPAAAPLANPEPERRSLDPASELEEALLESDPFRRMEKFSRLMASLTAADAPMVAAKFDELRSRGSPFASEFRLFLRAWGKLDGLAAVEKAWAASGPSAARGELKASPEMISAIAGWASTSPYLAQNWVGTLPESKEKENLIYGLLDGWAIVDFRGAAAYAEARPRSEARTNSGNFLWNEPSPAGASLPRSSGLNRFRMTNTTNSTKTGF